MAFPFNIAQGVDKVGGLLGCRMLGPGPILLWAGDVIY